MAQMGGSPSSAGCVMHHLAPVHQAPYDLSYPAPFQSHAEFMFSLTTSNNFGQADVILHKEIYCALNTGYVQIIFVYILLHTIPYVATISVDLLGGNNVYDHSFQQYWLLLPCFQ